MKKEWWKMYILLMIVIGSIGMFISFEGAVLSCLVLLLTNSIMKN